jgi:hypothetical protein
MTKIFGDFLRLYSEKMAIFLKTNVKILPTYLYGCNLSQNHQFFPQFLAKIYFLNYNIGPWRRGIASA